MQSAEISLRAARARCAKCRDFPRKSSILSISQPGRAGYTECFLGLGTRKHLTKMMCTKFGTVHQIRNPRKSCSENQIFRKFSKMMKEYLFLGGLNNFFLGLGTVFLIWAQRVPTLGSISEKILGGGTQGLQKGHFQ